MFLVGTDKVFRQGALLLLAGNLSSCHLVAPIPSITTFVYKPPHACVLTDVTLQSNTKGAVPTPLTDTLGRSNGPSTMRPGGSFLVSFIKASTNQAAAAYSSTYRIQCQGSQTQPLSITVSTPALTL